MRRVKGTYNGSCVVLREPSDLPPNTDVEVLIPEHHAGTLKDLLDELDKRPTGQTLSMEEIVALVHEVREGKR
jgi:hypothetical protein